MPPAAPEPSSATTDPVRRIPGAAPALGVLTTLPLVLLTVFVALTDGRRGDEPTPPAAPTAEERADACRAGTDRAPARRPVPG